MPFPLFGFAGKVPIEFHINTGKLVNQVIDVSPLSGRVEAGQKQKIKTTFHSRLPLAIQERFEIAVAYFDPVRC